jgi:hypothetical protein
MSPDGRFRSSDRSRRFPRALVICAAASALLLARNSSPQFRDTSSIHTVRADAHHDQRPRFDDIGSRYCAANTTFVLSPPTEVHAHLTLATALLFSFPTKGAHYTRPPPLSFSRAL